MADKQWLEVRISADMYRAMRRYVGLTGKRRTELASAIDEELRPRLDDAVGISAFSVIDEEDALTSITAFQDKEAAETSSKRASAETELVPEVSVSKIERASPPKRKGR